MSQSALGGITQGARKAARKGRKGHLYRPEPVHHGPGPEEEVRILKRRLQKAERDERMDITLALTPPKTYMGGFTRPRDLRAANWFPGGPYIQRGKIYESPHPTAYEPHTVFLLESRHRVRHGVGRVDAKDHIVGVCRAVDFVKLVQKYNSVRCPADARESMDNACWPWLPRSGKVLKPTRWWAHNEKLEDIMKEIYEDDNYVSKDVEQVMNEAEEEIEEEEDPHQKNKKKKVDETGVELEPNATGARDSHPTVSLSENADRTAPPHMATAPAPLDVAKKQQTSHREFDVNKIRAYYEPRLSAESFWLPLLATTYSTRPVALTMARLSKGRDRGLPFYASMTNDDRKCLFSYGNRMTSMRLDRMRQLTIDIISRFTGHKGGFIGIRFATGAKGRGVQGEGLAYPIPSEKRIVRVQIGSWYYRARDEIDLYQAGAEEWGGNDALDIVLMSERGRRLDTNGNEVPLTEEEMSTDEVQGLEDEDTEAELDRELAEEDEENLLRDPRLPGPPGMKKWKFKPALTGNSEDAIALRRKLAYRLGDKHRSVIRV